MTGVDRLVYGLYKHKHKNLYKKPFRTTKGKKTLIELVPSPYFFVSSICLAYMNMFARFDENPAMTLQDTLKGNKTLQTDARTDGRTDNVKTVYPPQTKFAGV